MVVVAADKESIKKRRELKKRVVELTKAGSTKPSDLDKLQQATAQWHASATAYKEAESEFECWMEDFALVISSTSLASRE